MLVFQTAGVALLATMIGAIAVAGARGRFGDADQGSEEPTLTHTPPLPPLDSAKVAPGEDEGEDEHAGHGGHG